MATIATTSASSSAGAAAGGDVSQSSGLQNDGHGDGTEGSSCSEAIGGSYIDTIVKMAIGRIADNIGWNSIGSLSLDILTEVTGKYIQSMGRNSMRFANMSGRTHVTLPDVGLAFNQLHFNLTGLQEYISSVQPHPVPIRVSKVPAAIRPSNRIKFACQQPTDTPFGDDIEIGYAVTDSEDEEDDDADEEAEDSMEKDYLSAACTSTDQKNGNDRRRVFRRSDYYEGWMPAFPEPEKIAPTSLTPADHNQNSQSNSLKEGTSDSQTEPAIGAGLKVSELEPSSHLSYIHFNSAGLIVPVNGVTPVEPDKSFPDDSGPESLMDSEDESESMPNAQRSSEENMTPQKPIDKLTIKNTGSLTKSLKSRKKLDKLEKGSKSTSKKSSKGPISLSIKVSGLMAGTPTASPKLPVSDVPLAPEIEERMDSTIDDVIAAASRAVPSPPEPRIISTNLSTPGAKKVTVKREPKSSAKKKEKEYSSREFVESEDDSEEEEEHVTDSKDMMSPVSSSLPPFTCSSSPSPRKVPASPSSHVRKGDRTVNETIDSVIKSVMSKAVSPAVSPSRQSPSHRKHMTPERNSSSASPATAGVAASTGKIATKAAAKHFPEDTKPINKIESEAAEILMAFSTKPVETPALNPTPGPTGINSRSSSPPSFSPFNLGKALAAGAFTSFPPSTTAVSAPIHEMIGQTSDIHPFAPNPPPSLPFKTLAMKKAFDDPLPPPVVSKRGRSPASDSDEEEKPVKKNKKSEEEDEEKRRKKEKKKKKRESRDKEKEKKKKDKKKEKTDSNNKSGLETENIPKLSIKLPSATPKPAPSAPLDSIQLPVTPVPVSRSKIVKEPKVKKEKEEVKSKAAAGGCILISETIKQTSSTASSAADAKGKVKGKKQEKETGNKKAAENKSKAKDSKAKAEEEAGDEDEGDKIWICPACKLPDDGSPMIGCDNCEEWYHWTCVGIKKDPTEDSWFCPRCTEKQRKIEQGLTRSVKKEKRKFDDVDQEDDSGRKKKKKKKPG